MLAVGLAGMTVGILLGVLVLLGVEMTAHPELTVYGSTLLVARWIHGRLFARASDRT